MPPNKKETKEISKKKKESSKKKVSVKKSNHGIIRTVAMSVPATLAAYLFGIKVSNSNLKNLETVNNNELTLLKNIKDLQINLRTKEIEIDELTKKDQNLINELTKIRNGIKNGEIVPEAVIELNGRITTLKANLDILKEDLNICNTKEIEYNKKLTQCDADIQQLIKCNEEVIRLQELLKQNNISF